MNEKELKIVEDNFTLRPSRVGDGMEFASTIDGSYFTIHSMIDDEVKMLAKFGITEQIQNHKGIEDHSCCIGFNPVEQKWYGWSHRAIYGFGVGSKCEKGNCHYVPATADELLDSVTAKDDDGYAWQKPENVEKIEGGIRIRIPMTTCGPSSIIDLCDNVIDLQGESLSPDQAADSFFELQIGRGEWVAETLDDARQMAVDFAEGVG